MPTLPGCHSDTYGSAKSFANQREPETRLV